MSIFFFMLNLSAYSIFFTNHILTPSPSTPAISDCHKERTVKVRRRHLARCQVLHDRNICVSLSALCGDVQRRIASKTDMPQTIGRKSSPNTYDVKMDDAAIIGGMFGLPVEMETKINLELL